MPPELEQFVEFRAEKAINQPIFSGLRKVEFQYSQDNYQQNLLKCFFQKFLPGFENCGEHSGILQGALGVVFCFL